MKNNIRYFIAQNFYNIKNAHALARSFWIGVVSMILNNLTFFVIWMLFMKATGPINGWTSIDVFGMLGVATMCFGVGHSFFYGVIELPTMVQRGNFDGVLLSPANMFFKLAGSGFSITAYGDLIMGVGVTIFYGIYMHFSLYLWFLFIMAIILGCIVFVTVRFLCSILVFYMHDSDTLSTQLFEIFMRPSLYPGAIFPSTLKIFFMTVIPALVTSALPIDIVKSHSLHMLLFSAVVTLVWFAIAQALFKNAVRLYESGNFMR